MPPRLLPDTRLGSEEQPCKATAAITQQVKISERFMILGVRYVLEGSVRKAGDRVRITAQLIDDVLWHQNRAFRT